jgi:hypothetical protein
MEILDIVDNFVNWPIRCDYFEEEKEYWRWG